MKLQFLMLISAALVTIDGSVAYSGIALQFDGISDPVAIPDTAEPCGHRAGPTVEASVPPSDISNGPHIGPEYLRRNTRDRGMSINPKDLLAFQRESGAGSRGGNGYAYASEPAFANQWNHVAFVLDNDGDILCLCLNGVLVGSRDIAADHPAASAAVWIGGSGPFYYQHCGSNMFSGYIDDVRTWGVARANGKIFGNMRSGGITGDEDGLVACWNFDEDSGPGAYDSSSYAGDMYLGSVAGLEDKARTSGPGPAIPALYAFLLGCLGLALAGWVCGVPGK
jgi:hypothetical protein